MYAPTFCFREANKLMDYFVSCVQLFGQRHAENENLQNSHHVDALPWFLFSASRLMIFRSSIVPGHWHWRDSSHRVENEFGFETTSSLVEHCLCCGWCSCWTALLEIVGSSFNASRSSCSSWKKGEDLIYLTFLFRPRSKHTIGSKVSPRGLLISSFTELILLFHVKSQIEGNTDPIHWSVLFW